MNEQNSDKKLMAETVADGARTTADLEKLQLLGRLVSGITHEINTPMHYLENNLTFLKVAFKDLFELHGLYRQLLLRLRSGEAATEKDWQALDSLESGVEPDYLHSEIGQAVAQSLEGIDMVSRIVLALKDFSHPSLHEFSLTDVNKCIDTVCTISRHEWKRVADLKFELAGDLPFLFCSRDEIHQVLLNLIVNAAHAIGEKISARVYDRGLITITTVAHGNHVEIIVRDDGPGIAVEHQKSIFTPHFTTKTAGKGTGLGLSLVRHIVEQRHGGSIVFSTTQGQGTVFTMVLPHRPDESHDRCGDRL